MTSPHSARTGTIADTLYDAFYSGGIAGSIVALFFLLLDAIEGQPFFTPSLMGTVLFSGVPAEAATGGASGVSISASNSEVLWCAYAWPSSFGNSGKRTFFVNQAGDVLACRNNTQRYNGTTNPVGTNAAFLAGSANVMGSTVAANATGKDGERWIVVN